MKIYLIYNDYAFPLSLETKYVLGKDDSYDISLPIESELILTVTDRSVLLKDEEYECGIHDVLLCDNIYVRIIILHESKYFMMPKGSLYITNKEESTIQLIDSDSEILFSSDKNHLWYVISGSEYFLNGHRRSGKSKIRENDILVFENGIVISLYNNIINIATIFEVNTKLIEVSKSNKKYRGDEFHRSPRIILREPESKVSIASAPTDDELSRQSLIKLLITPVAMIIFTFLIYFFTNSSGMVFMMMGMSVITIGTSLHSYFYDKKQHKEKQKQKIKDYLSYLDTKYKELKECKEEQIEALNYHYPDVFNILDMAKSLDRRIYEKTPYHFDFLRYRLGSGEIPTSFYIDYTSAELTKYNKEAGEKVNELISYYQYIDDMPIQNTINSPIGYIGNRKVVIEQVQQLMIQIATFHSYYDVEFFPIFREEEFDMWNWSRWLPHTQIRMFNSRGFIYNQKTRDQLLTSLYQIIKERKLDKEQSDKSKEKIYLPHYVLLITDLSLLLDHNIMEYINEDLTELGIHYIFVEEVIESLPEHVKTVVDYRGAKKANLILQNGEYVNKEFIPLPVIKQSDKENFARNMAGINHVQTLRNSIPESITFLEMYGVRKVEELNILNRWKVNEAYKTMAVPLGVRGREDILYLNLHEKAHGPHGLIAGTTGSGKSELVQSYILSLAVNYHPYEVAFLLIDYKGGGMSNLFADLPHVVGTITNLDGNQANRALVSIKAELKKRQRIFSENDVNHIDQYMKLFKEGKVKMPLPHLFIISDEFAELKTNQPDFMDELVSTARIGRSLGVHLILATQKPSGVVNDQIWSNSKFKIALKVQDVTDSREVIKTSDAAEITQVGRAYLQVGNNEIYELFQSAWSGADYVPDGVNENHKETVIYEITDSGQYAPINKDLSGLANKKEIKTVPTELDAVVDLAGAAFETLNVSKVESPWLPPLESNIYAKDLQEVNFKDYWNKNKGELNILVGYKDVPENQEQSPMYFNMNKTGHILLLGSPGFGKSTFLQTFAIDVMRKKTPEEAHFYLYDFGASGLISLQDFPHVADYFSLDETEKILKSLRRLNSMVKERKSALSKYKATNLEQYNQLSEDKFASTFILVDGFDSVSDSAFSESFYEVLSVIARDGASLGMYLVVSLSRLNAMRLQLQSNFKTKISLFLFDNSDLSGIVGKSNILLDEIKGRAITKIEDIIQFQITLPYESENYGSYIKSVNKEVSSMRKAYKGKLPECIPMLPEKVTIDRLENEFADNRLLIGLEQEEVVPACFNLDMPIIMAAEGLSFVKNYYKLLDYHLNRFDHRYSMVILDSGQRVPNEYFKNAQRFSLASDLSEVFRTIISDLKERMELQNRDEQKWLILIPDIAALAVNASINEADLKLLISEGPKFGVIPIFIGGYQELINNSYDPFVKLTTQLVDQVFLGVRISDQNYIRYPYIRNEVILKPNQGYILYSDYYEFIQLMEV